MSVDEELEEARPDTPADSWWRARAAPRDDGGAAAGERGATAWTLLAGGSVLVLLGAGFVAAMAGFALGARLGWWVLVPAFASQEGYLFWAWRPLGPRRAASRTAIAVLVCALVLICSGLAANRVADTSEDGRHYQAESVLALANGWNPVHGAPLHWTRNDPSVWTNSYPKAIWTLQAVTLNVAGSIETTKLVGIALLLAAALVSFAGLTAAGLRPWVATACAVALALNPVTSSQLATHMVDGIMGALLLATIMLTLMWVWGGSRVALLPPLAFALILLVNTKFTGPVFALLLIAPLLVVAGLLAYLGRRRLVSMVAALAICLAFGVVVLGFNPYVTNTLRHGHPFYPLYGGQLADIETYAKAGSLRHENALERLVVSLSSASDATQKEPRLKVPLTFTRAEWDAFRLSTVRIGGLGPLFSGGLLLAVLGAGAFFVGTLRGRVTSTVEARTLMAAAGLCLLTVLVTPNSFLVRYVPQLWGAALIVFIALLLVRTRRWLRLVAWCGIGILLVNAFGVAAAATRLKSKDADRQATVLRKLRNFPGAYDAEFGAWRRAEERRLRSAGVHYRAVPRATCEHALWLGVSGSLAFVDTYHLQRPASGVLLCARRR